MGLGIARRVLPPGKPWRNGAVEHSWAGEPDGLAALQTVWNHGKPTVGAARPYADRAGFDLEQVWQGLARVRVGRSVDPQGKLSVWDRPLRIGRRWAHRTVVVTFDAGRRVAVIRDTQETTLVERPLPWLTVDWLWVEIDVAAQACGHDGTSTFR